MLGARVTWQRPGATERMSNADERIDTLDLLRGIAALAVVSLHFAWPGGAVPFPRAYLAVDVFFVLSGFVIAYAYQYRLDSGMPVRRYFLARLVRLYPLYIFATLLGAAWIAQGLLRQGSIEALGPWALALAGAALFLPDPLGARALFPLNEPAWSLFFELLVNLLYGALAVRLSNRILGALILAGAALLGFAIAQMGTLNVGFDWDNAAWGSGRALFSFFVGVGVFRCRQRHRLTAESFLFSKSTRDRVARASILHRVDVVLCKSGVHEK